MDDTENHDDFDENSILDANYIKEIKNEQKRDELYDNMKKSYLEMFDYIDSQSLSLGEKMRFEDFIEYVVYTLKN